MLGKVVAVQALDGGEVHLALVATWPDLRDDFEVIFVGVRHVAVVNLGCAELTPEQKKNDINRKKKREGRRVVSIHECVSCSHP